MHYELRHIEINIPDSVFRLNHLPEATKFLTLAYVILTSTLFVVRSLEYNGLVATDPSLNFGSVISPVLQLIPNRVLKYPFSIVLSNFVDVEIWKIIVNILNLVIGGSFIERNWNSSKEMLKFTILIGSLTNLMVVISTVILSFIIPSVEMDIPLDGNYTVLIGFSIVYKQLFPETTIFQLKRLGFFSKNFRFKLLPVFVMFTMTVAQLIFFHHFAQLLSIWMTFFSCWIYLRFYQVLKLNEADGYLVGDASDTFQLIYFFPDVVKPIIRPIADFMYHIFCVKLRLIRSFQTDDIDKGNSVAQQRGAKTPANPVEERRKRLALQVLQERMVEP